MDQIMILMGEKDIKKLRVKKDRVVDDKTE